MSVLQPRLGSQSFPQQMPLKLKVQLGWKQLVKFFLRHNCIQHQLKTLGAGKEQRAGEPVSSTPTLALLITHHRFPERSKGLCLGNCTDVCTSALKLLVLRNAEADSHLYGVDVCVGLTPVPQYKYLSSPS